MALCQLPRCRYAAAKSSLSSRHTEVIVDFPKRTRSHRRHHSLGGSLGGSLKKSDGPKTVAPEGKPRRSSSRAQEQDQGQGRRPRRSQKVDWRNSSLDWGNDDDTSD